MPENALLVSMDATGLFDNIPPTEGLETLEEALDERTNLKVPINFTKKLMQLVLEWNLFTFHNAAYLQKVGVAMGTHPAPDYSDIFMARKIDKMIWSISEKLKEEMGKETALHAQHVFNKT